MLLHFKIDFHMGRASKIFIDFHEDLIAFLLWADLTSCETFVMDIVSSASVPSFKIS